jgi:hypothetical protein
LPARTVADVVADVLAASDEGDAALDVPSYLAERGHTWTTIETVVAYLQRQRDRTGPVMRLCRDRRRPRTTRPMVVRALLRRAGQALGMPTEAVRGGHAADHAVVPTPARQRTALLVR